jgi:hypothetical protein
MQFSDLVDTAGGMGAFVAILGVAIFGALVCLAITSNANS